MDYLLNLKRSEHSRTNGEVLHNNHLAEGKHSTIFFCDRQKTLDIKNKRRGKKHLKYLIKEYRGVYVSVA